MASHTPYQAHTGSQAPKFYKTTLFEGAHMLVGLNCLDPGQSQPYMGHGQADRAYLVMEGRGLFTVGDETFEVGPGEIIWAGGGTPHGVENTGAERLTLLVAIAPPPTG